jgi:hypothetical protein
MAKKKLDPTRVSLNMGSLSFLAILIVAAMASLFEVPAEYAEIPLMVMALLGAIIAIDNITKNEELMFMVASLTVMMFALFLGSFGALIALGLPDSLALFVIYISISFGIGGFIVALGAILKLGWNK